MKLFPCLQVDAKDAKITTLNLALSALLSRVETLEASSCSSFPPPAPVESSFASAPAGNSPERRPAPSRPAVRPRTASNSWGGGAFASARSSTESRPGGPAPASARGSPESQSGASMSQEGRPSPPRSGTGGGSSRGSSGSQGIGRVLPGPKLHTAAGGATQRRVQPSSPIKSLRWSRLPSGSKP